MSAPALDRVIHAPNRLRICAFLSPLKDAEFHVLRDALGVSDSVLSKHIKQLEEAGHLALRKETLKGRQRTWARLTPQGRRAFAGHMAALQALVDQASGSVSASGASSPSTAGTA